MSFAGLIFDFNGTMFFDTPYHVEAFDKLSMEICGKHVTLEMMESVFAGKPNVEIFKIMSEGRFSLEECEAYSRRKEAMYREAVRRDNPSLAPGLCGFFDYLKGKGIPFTIASASIIENITFFREIFHLDQWINPDAIVYDDGSYKDKVQMFLDAKARLNVEGSMLVFEDSLSGIDCSYKAGMQAVIIDRPVLRPYYDRYPHILAFIDDYRDFIPKFEKLNR